MNCAHERRFDRLQHLYAAVRDKATRRCSDDLDFANARPDDGPQQHRCQCPHQASCKRSRRRLFDADCRAVEGPLLRSKGSGHSGVSAELSCRPGRAESGLFRAIDMGSCCIAHSRENSPCCAISSCSGPCSITRPSSNTTIRLQWRRVERRWAIMITVRPLQICAMLAWIACSLSTSSALVASSRIRILGSPVNARAMAMRWRCPPDKRAPRSPTGV